jgi:hypothetical protein
MLKRGEDNRRRIATVDAVGEIGLVQTHAVGG